MDRWGDHEGKSRSASVMDREHFTDSGEDSQPTHAEIAARAYQLWIEQGRQSDSAEQNWLRAERELRSTATSRRLVDRIRERAGSLQR